MSIADTKRTYEAEIWERAEHWSFFVTIRAESEEEAHDQLLRDFPRRDYRIRSIR